MKATEKNLISIMRDFELKNNAEHEDMRLNHVKNQKDLQSVKLTTDRIEKKMDNFIKTADEKYAPIWVSKVMVWVGSIIGGAVLLALVSLVLIK